MQKIMLHVVLIAFGLAMAAGIASASRGIEVLNGSSVAFAFPNRQMVFGGAFGNIRCELTLRGSLHRTISKTSGSLVGYISEAQVAACGGSVGVTWRSLRILTGRLPWHIRYRGFGGTLPEITSVALSIVRPEVLMEFEALFSIFQCLWNSDQEGEVIRIEREAGASRITRDITIRGPSITPRSLNANSCPEFGLEATGTITPTIRMRLI